MQPVSCSQDLQCLLALSLSYALASSLIKLAILALYRRIFTSNLVRIGTYCIGGLVLCWFIAVELTTIFQCKPIKSMWDTSIAGTCIDNITFFTAIAATNIIFDLAILVLPLRDLCKLRMSSRRKTGVIGLFVLGGM